jgi:type I restriction enzyme, S subunit
MALPMCALQGKTKDAVKGATLNRQSIANILIPMPPLTEQARVVAKVNELMGVCDQLAAALVSEERYRSQLLESILREALEPNQASDLALAAR